MLNNSEYVKETENKQGFPVTDDMSFLKNKNSPVLKTNTIDNDNESSLSYIQRTTLIILSFSKRGGKTEEFFYWGYVSNYPAN